MGRANDPSEADRGECVGPERQAPEAGEPLCVMCVSTFLISPDHLYSPTIAPNND